MTKPSRIKVVKVVDDGEDYWEVIFSKPVDVSDEKRGRVERDWWFDKDNYPDELSAYAEAMRILNERYPG